MTHGQIGLIREDQIRRVSVSRYSGTLGPLILGLIEAARWELGWDENKALFTDAARFTLAGFTSAAGAAIAYSLTSEDDSSM